MSRAEDLFKELKSGGKKTLLSWIRKEKRAEDQFLEYKQCQGLQKPGDFSNKDQEKMSKALSGFGNTSGGIVVWGVECKSIDGLDVPTKPKPIKEIRKFKSKVDNLISALTYPALEGVETQAIENGKNGDGFLIVLIPRSNYVPIRSAKLHQYYLRSTSSTVIMPHDTLALHFGRRPEPIIKPYMTQKETVQSGRIEIRLRKLITFCNEGVTILKDFYVICRVLKKFGARTSVNFSIPSPDMWNEFRDVNSDVAFVAKNDLKIVPGTDIGALQMLISLKGPFTEDFELQLHYGCEGSKHHEFSIKANSQFLENVAKIFFDPVNRTDCSEEEFKGHRNLTNEKLQDFGRKVFSTVPRVEYLD